jgi:hypothetical protein
MVPSDGHQTSIFGRLGTRRLGTVISTISSVVRPSQGSLEFSPLARQVLYIISTIIYIFTLDFPWLDPSRDYLLRTVRLPLHCCHPYYPNDTECSIAPNSPVSFYCCSVYVIVVNSKLLDLCFIVIIPSTLPHLLHFILKPL